MFCYKTNSTNKENRVKKIPGNSRTNFPGFRDNKIAGIPGISRPGNSREFQLFEFPAFPGFFCGIPGKNLSCYL